MEKNDITLREAAKLLEINKSKLHYYVSIGLLKPKGEIAGIFFFNKTVLLRTIKKISALRKKDHTLKEIRDMIIK